MLRFCHRCQTSHDIRRGCPETIAWGGRRVGRTRQVILARDEHTCQGCGAGPLRPDELHVDHIIPRAMGGTDTADNLQALCVRCNLAKGNR